MGPGPCQPTNCAVCGALELKRIFTKKGRDFWECLNCQLQMQFPLPSYQSLAAYYDASFQAGMYEGFAAAEEMKQMTAQQRLREIQRHLPIEHGRWLDVGCANGVFLQAIGERVSSVEGVEISAVAVQRARDRGLQVFCGSIETLDRETKYDCITAFDVLEHVLDPLGFVGEIRDRLEAAGHLILTLPDTAAVVRHLMGRRWYFYIPEEHLHYFNRQNLSELLAKSGFSVVWVGRAYKPLTYDYSLQQFAEYNPLIYRILSFVGRAVPRCWRSRIIPLPIGEMMLIAKKSALA